MSEQQKTIDVDVDPWVMLARWQLGRISDDEYADYLEASGEWLDPADMVAILRARADRAD